MKLLGLAAVLMVGMAGWGQTCPSGSLPGNEFSPYTHGETPITHCWNDLTGKATALSPAPLKCGKYEHVEHWPHCTPQDRSGLCDDKCVPDMHEVTEKEWQELQSKLKQFRDGSEKGLWLCVPGEVCVRIRASDLRFSAGPQMCPEGMLCKAEMRPPQ